MSENQTEKKHLPTGEEPPKGYETLAAEQTDNNVPKVDFVMYSHLARTERAEIEALRSRAFEEVQRYIGLSNEPLTIEREVRLISTVEDSNKMFALAFLDNQLAGYSLVALGCPEPCKWLIQHMIIDPQKRNRGIGTTIVKSIERYASESEVAADSIYAIPVQESGIAFWKNNGYTVEAARVVVTSEDVNHEVVIYHKAL